MKSFLSLLLLSLSLLSVAQIDYQVYLKDGKKVNDLIQIKDFECAGYLRKFDDSIILFEEKWTDIIIDSLHINNRTVDGTYFTQGDSILIFASRNVKGDTSYRYANFFYRNTNIHEEEFLIKEVKPDLNHLYDTLIVTGIVNGKLFFNLGGNIFLLKNKHYEKKINTLDSQVGFGQSLTPLGDYIVSDTSRWRKINLLVYETPSSIKTEFLNFYNNIEEKFEIPLYIGYNKKGMWFESDDYYYLISNWESAHQGNVFYDENQDGVKQAGELFLSNRQIKVDGQLHGVSNALGDFYILNDGSDTIEVALKLKDGEVITTDSLSIL